MSSTKDTDPIAEALQELGVITTPDNPDYIREVQWPQMDRVRDMPTPEIREPYHFLRKAFARRYMWRS